MGRISKKFKLFLIVLFSFWILIFPSYIYFSTLGDSDITSYYPVFGTNDQEDSISCLEKKEMILILTFFIKHIAIAKLSLSLIPNLSSQLTTLNSKSLILRC